MRKNKYSIIGVSGKKGSGKDTFHKLFNKHAPYKYQNSKFTDKLRSIASKITGLPVSYFYNRSMYDKYLEDWGMTIREILQKLGLEALRENFDTQVWIKTFFANYNKEENHILTDVRFPNEIEAIQKNGGIVIRIQGRGDNDGDQHGSESALDGYEGYDYIIDNVGDVEEYEQAILDLVNTLFTNADFLEYPVTLRSNSVGHYNKEPGWIEPIEVIVNSNMNFCQGNYIKYLSRHESKGQAISDLNKALDYLYWAIEGKATSIVAKNSEGVSRKIFFDKFIKQHPETTIELIEFFLQFEYNASRNASWNDDIIISKFYEEINQYSIETFGKELTSNIFYDLLHKES